MQTFQLVATCAAGIESTVNRELKKMGYHPKNANGRIFFEGGLADIARTNLWLRTADRVKIVMGKAKVTSFDELYEFVKSLEWETILPMDASFPVSGKSVKSKLHAVPTVQKMGKKAIVDRLNAFYHHTGFLPETGAVYPINIRIDKDVATITLDTTGDSLFKRGYRVNKGAAPLKENLAAALIDLTTWFPDRPLYDPTTGSGTIAIEAAHKGMRIAPGLNRHFLAEDWDIFSKEFDLVREEARDFIQRDIKMDILACDIDQQMVAIAQENAKAAGVFDQITFKQMQVADFRTDKEFGIIIANPPYGERLKDQKYAHQLYAEMGTIYNKMPTWSKYIISADPDFEKFYKMKATKKRKIYNGALKTDYYQFWGTKS